MSAPTLADRTVPAVTAQAVTAQAVTAQAVTTPTVLPAATLLAAARSSLAEAALAPSPALRYAESHLAALRCAAAVLAARARPVARGRRRPRPTSAWVLLTAVAPELGEWAAFFAAGAATRSAAEADVPGAVSTRQADDLLRDAATFLAVVETTLGVPHQPTVPGLLVGRRALRTGGAAG